MWRLWSTRTSASLFGMWEVRTRYEPNLHLSQIVLQFSDSLSSLRKCYTALLWHPLLFVAVTKTLFVYTFLCKLPVQVKECTVIWIKVQVQVVQGLCVQGLVHIRILISIQSEM
jgi:hypothetical protein